jgi:succinyl-CoA synthetase alpha subunit
MSILVDKKTRLVVQGITGYQGAFHTGLMLQAGTKVVAGVTPGKGGTKTHDVPVFDTVDEAVRARGANACCIFVPARFARDAALEAVASGLDPVVIITDAEREADASLRARNARKVLLVPKPFTGSQVAGALDELLA